MPAAGGILASIMNPLRLFTSLAAGGVALIAAVIYWMRSHRKTPEQREAERRQRISAHGRIIDGTLLDVRDVTVDGRSTRLLLYRYDVRGVSYECSQDITQLRRLLDVESCRIGLPASVKYDPHNPSNSIVVAEGWSGLRR